MPAIADVPRFSPTFTSWDLTGRDLTVPASVSMSVDGFSTHCIGGPKAARIRAGGHPNDLWEFMNWLRAPVDISYRGWPPVWWGFVSAVEININRARLRVSLDGMHNRIAIAHTITTGTKSERATTGWAEDALSIERYGYRELLKSSTATSTAQAEAERNDQLAQLGRPLSAIAFNGTPGDVSATIECSGWWDTLGWRYYTNAGTNDVANETQISAIVTAAGQFITGYDSLNATSISTKETQTGDKTALAIIEDLMEAGVSSGRRLLSTVYRGRILQTYQQPAATDGAWAIDTTGNIRNALGTIVEPWRCPSGYWATINDYLPAMGRDQAGLSYGRFFVEEAEYVCATGEYRPTATGTVNPWTLGRRMLRQS